MLALQEEDRSLDWRIKWKQCYLWDVLDGQDSCTMVKTPIIYNDLREEPLFDESEEDEEI